MTEVVKKLFINDLSKFSDSLSDYVSTCGSDWSIKGFVDTKKKIYSISSDTKIISKILEIQLFPKYKEFADQQGYDLVLAKKQNWYPDLSFVKKDDESIKFALDIKTTYRDDSNLEYCNGFTLGSHGEYFQNHQSSKNIQYPYGQYLSHLVLGIVYTRHEQSIDETRIYNMDNLLSITSVIKDLEFFVQEKWKLASDKRGSGNTANIGSIKYIPNLIKGKGLFKNLGEDCFNRYWQNYRCLKIGDNGEKLTDLEEFLKFKNIDTKKICTQPKRTRKNDKGTSNKIPGNQNQTGRLD